MFSVLTDFSRKTDYFMEQVEEVVRWKQFRSKVSAVCLTPSYIEMNDALFDPFDTQTD